MLGGVWRCLLHLTESLQVDLQNQCFCFSDYPGRETEAQMTHGLRHSWFLNSGSLARSLGSVTGCTTVFIYKGHPNLSTPACTHPVEWWWWWGETRLGSGLGSPVMHTLAYPCAA